MKWGKIAERFNQKFAGKIVEGSKTPRPARTRLALRSERSRVKEIIDYTGIVPKHQKVGRVQRRSTANAIENKSDKEGEPEQDGPSSTRRGDVPPGKPPRKDDDDSHGGGALDARSPNNVVGA